ncbi:hypothetical protein NDU88_004985 [Pleurodeles waltl]|uniref:Uncharacterized protein n=1 Tax=Pleurodeles waltl TaxID=8319 RepID=A0AAV7NQ34_PLEWA|nr:hypothetical protein NDU88_004985 [Pleurodeles waltl]
MEGRREQTVALDIGADSAAAGDQWFRLPPVPWESGKEGVARRGDRRGRTGAGGPRGAGRPREELTGAGAWVEDRRCVRRSTDPAGIIWRGLGRAPVKVETGGWGLVSILEPEGLLDDRRAAATRPSPQENTGRGPGQEVGRQEGLNWGRPRRNGLFC